MVHGYSLLLVQALRLAVLDVGSHGELASLSQDDMAALHEVPRPRRLERTNTLGQCPAHVIYSPTRKICFSELIRNSVVKGSTLINLY